MAHQELQVAYQKLQESEEKYRSLFDAMDQGFCVIEKVETAAGEKSDFRYVAANPAFERHTHLHEVVGKTIRELVPGAEDRIMDVYDEVVRTGRHAHIEDRVDVNKERRKDQQREVRGRDEQRDEQPAQTYAVFQRIERRPYHENDNSGGRDARRYP